MSDTVIDRMPIAIVKIVNPTTTTCLLTCIVFIHNEQRLLENKVLYHLVDVVCVYRTQSATNYYAHWTQLTEAGNQALVCLAAGGVLAYFQPGLAIAAQRLLSNTNTICP
jgi:hypothetical protein